MAGLITNNQWYTHSYLPDEGSTNTAKTVFEESGDMHIMTYPKRAYIVA